MLKTTGRPIDHTTGISLAENTAQEVEMNRSIFNPFFQDPPASKVNLPTMNEQSAETETVDADASTDKSRRHSDRRSIRPTPVHANTGEVI